jgi:hypothetical protein
MVHEEAQGHAGRGHGEEIKPRVVPAGSSALARERGGGQWRCGRVGCGQTPAGAWTSTSSVREQARTVAGEVGEQLLVWVLGVGAVETEERAGAQEAAAGGWCVCVGGAEATVGQPGGFVAAPQWAEVGDTPVVGVGATRARAQDVVSLTGRNGVLVVV